MKRTLAAAGFAVALTSVVALLRPSLVVSACDNSLMVHSIDCSDPEVLCVLAAKHQVVGLEKTAAEFMKTYEEGRQEQAGDLRHYFTHGDENDMNLPPGLLAALQRVFVPLLWAWWQKAPARGA